MISIPEMLSEENLVEKFLNERGKHFIFLYGLGAGTVWYIRLLERLNIPIAGMCDSTTEKEKEISFAITDEEQRTYKVYPLKEICSRWGTQADYVIVAPRHRHAIKKTIENSGLHGRIYAFDAAPIVLQNRMPCEYKEYLTAHAKRLETLYEILADKKSKLVLQNCLRGYITSDCDCYKGTASTSQYFPDIIRKVLKTDEVFVDVGAYNGDSIEEFLSVVGSNYKRIYAFEPEPVNYCLAQKKFSDQRIKFFMCGCGEYPNEAKIVHVNGYEGTQLECEFDDQLQECVSIIRLDDVIAEAVTYIKMDIEGMELSALKGAKHIIRRNHPKLAISVYHKKEDLIEISEYLRNLDSTYKFYLRHYWDCSGTDIILFAL